MSQPFPEPAATPPGWRPPPDGGLNSRPHTLQGPYWVSFDRQHWWNGSAWIPGPPPPQPPSAPGGTSPVAMIVGLIVFAIFAVIVFGIWTSMQGSGIPGAPMP